MKPVRKDIPLVKLEPEQKEELYRYLHNEARNASSEGFGKVIETLTEKGIVAASTIGDTVYVIAATRSKKRLQVKTDSHGTGINVWLLREDAEEFRVMVENGGNDLCVVPVKLVLV